MLFIVYQQGSQDVALHTCGLRFVEEQEHVVPLAASLLFSKVLLSSENYFFLRCLLRRFFIANQCLSVSTGNKRHGAVNSTVLSLAQRNGQTMRQRRIGFAIA